MTYDPTVRLIDRPVNNPLRQDFLTLCHLVLDRAGSEGNMLVAAGRENSPAGGPRGTRGNPREADHKGGGVFVIGI
ncbi:hypothetical protein, partial [Microbispora sp. NPDC046933]|uniref:hypothetical protein n=1 Tax=Microbispora sp. NPDC046933 TaxID=3155618 RepID=UPI0033DB5ED7